MYEICIKNNKIENEELSKISKELEKIKKLNHNVLLKFIGYRPIDFKKTKKTSNRH